MRKRIVIFLSFCFFLFRADAQRFTHTEYINQFKQLAVEEMVRTGVPASITLAQGILESEYGNSPLVKSSNNHFGIKCKSNWTGPSIKHDDDEAAECFRMYNNAEESYRDHSDFLKNSSRYASLFNLDPLDYKSWAHGLKKAGYATNPRYADLLIKYVEMFNLQEYDVMALNGANTMFASAGTHENKIIEPPAEAKPAAEPAKVAAVLARKPAPFEKVKINQVNAVWVPEGTSLLAVAMKYKIRLPKLLEYNDLKRDGLLQKDQYVFLEKKPTAGSHDFGYSQQGESLYDLSQRYGVALKSIAEFNQMQQQSVLSPGTKIYLKAPAAVAAREKPEGGVEKTGVL